MMNSLVKVAHGCATVEPSSSGRMFVASPVVASSVGTCSRGENINGPDMHGDVTKMR